MPRLTITKWSSLLLCYGFAASSWAAQTNVMEGDWVGGFEDGKDWIYLQAHFKPDGAKVTGTFDRPLEFVMGAELDGVVLQSPRIQFAVEKPQRLRFDGKLGDGVMDGEVCGGDPVPKPRISTRTCSVQNHCGCTAPTSANSGCAILCIILFQHIY